jgi:hypothetical protein
LTPAVHDPASYPSNCRATGDLIRGLGSGAPTLSPGGEERGRSADASLPAKPAKPVEPS